MRFDFGHNYNQTSREAVYDWFGKWLLKDPNSASLKEQPYQKEPDAELRVFPDGKLPEDAVSEARLIEALKDSHRAQWESLLVRNEAGLARIQPDHAAGLAAHPAARVAQHARVRSRAEKVRQVG